MNHFSKIILILLVTVTFFSCNDEFINEKLDISGVAKSAIIISPNWEADDYEFMCEGVKNADFTVTSKPEWLILESSSGEITDSIATIHGSANEEPLFSNIGFYVDQMVITTNGKQFAVPLYYITEGTPSIQVNRSIAFSYTNANNQLEISNTGDGVLLWDIVSVPNWLTVNTSLFNPTSVMLGKGNSTSLPFTFNIKAVVQNNLQGTIVLKTNDPNNPLVEIAVTANLGSPNINFYYRQLDFGISETIKTYQISNQGSGILIWRFEGLPKWLSVSTASGTVTPYGYSNYFTFTCKRDTMQPGLNSATFYLKSNDPDEPSIPITVSVRAAGTSANIKAIDGNIMDATFDKSTNTLYYVTGQPNKLVAYDVTAKTVLHEVALTKSPTCLAIDENFKKALVGHGGSISTVDLTTFQVTKTIELNAIVYDIEWSTDDWYCYTNANSNTSNLVWINSSSGETYQTPQTPLSYSLRTAVLKKVPNKPYIIACRKDVSPSGIFVFDLPSKALKSYTPASFDNTWFFKQGELMVTGNSSIVRTSAVTTVSGNQTTVPSSIGQLKIGQNTNAAWWIDYSEANHSIWALFSYYVHSYYPPVKGTIYRFEDNDYTLVKTYTYDNMYQPNTQTTPYEVEARYVFANKAGTELSVLRKGTNNTVWSVEFIPVQ